MRELSFFVLICVVYIGAFFGQAIHLGKTVYGDGVFYYSWLRSIVIDTDIDFRNEYERETVTQLPAKTNTPGNKYSIGPALAWFPGYFITHAIVNGDGWDFPYQIAVGFISVLAALSGIFLLYVFLAFPPIVKMLAIALLAGGTNLLYYGAIDPVNSHALTFFIATTLMLVSLKKDPPWLISGILLGLLSAIRLQDIVFALLFLPHIKKIRVPHFSIGFFIGIAPQLIAWIALYGSLKNPYLAGGESFNIFQFQILPVLFSARNGLFLWTPVVLLGLIGLLRNIKKYWHYLTIFIMQLIIVASWSSPDQGASVSGRMFVSTLPLIGIGLMQLTGDLYKRTLLRISLPFMASALILMNGIGIFYYLFTN